MFAGVLKKLIEKSVAGALVVDICELGDNLLKEETSKVYRKDKEVKKGMSECVFSIKYDVLSSSIDKV